MNKDKKLRYSLASYKQPNDDPCVDLTELAELLAKGPCHIPERLNLTKATELFHLGRAFIAMERELIAYQKAALELSWILLTTISC